MNYDAVNLAINHSVAMHPAVAYYKNGAHHHCIGTIIIVWATARQLAQAPVVYLHVPAGFTKG